MDLYCPKCGEPWDNDTFHEAASEQDTTYRVVIRNFQAKGCEAIGWGTCSYPEISEREVTFGLTRAEAANALYDVLGDDTDGAASMMSDLFD